jgi:hypothetical protein
MSARRTKEERAAIAEARAKRARAEAEAAKDDRIKAVLRAHDLAHVAINTGLRPEIEARLVTARMALRAALEEMGAPLP